MDFKALGKQIKTAFGMEDIAAWAREEPELAAAAAGGLGGAGLGALTGGGSGALMGGLAGAGLGGAAGHYGTQYAQDNPDVLEGLPPALLQFIQQQQQQPGPQAPVPQ